MKTRARGEASSFDLPEEEIATKATEVIETETESLKIHSA